MAMYVEPSAYFTPSAKKILKEGEKTTKKPASKPAPIKSPKKKQKTSDMTKRQDKEKCPIIRLFLFVIVL